MQQDELQVCPWPVHLWRERQRWYVLFVSTMPSVLLTIVVDIGDFLTDEIRGPAKFTCKNGDQCRFEEPQMNDLIDQMFGDRYITLTCEGGECLHKSQVPGYVRPPRPDNSQWIAVSLAIAGALVLAVSASTFSSLRVSASFS
jgi:hypothetical protein